MTTKFKSILVKLLNIKNTDNSEVEYQNSRDSYPKEILNTNKDVQDSNRRLMVEEEKEVLDASSSLPMVNAY